MAILNTSTSIVDFLKSQGKPSDFTSRTNLYASSGLGSAFGDYRGSPEQNIALLRKIQTPTPTVTPTLPPPTVAPTLPPLEPPSTPKKVIEDTTPATTSNIFDLPEIKEATADVSGALTRAAVSIPRSVEELKAGAEVTKATLAQKGAGLTERLRGQFETVGLFRSGKREKGEAQIAQEVAQKQGQAESKLGSDLYNLFSKEEKQFGTKFIADLSIPEAQEFAKIPAPVRGAVMVAYENAITKAQEKAAGQAEKTLGALGYVLLPDGTIVQKPSEIRAEEAGVRAEEAAVRAEKPPIQKEYEFAVSQGFEGSLLDYQKLKATQFGTERETAGTAEERLAREPAFTPGFSNRAVEKSFREDLTDIKIRQNITDSTQQYDALRTLYAPQEVSDQAIKDMLGIKEELPSPEGIADNWLEEQELKRKAVKTPEAQPRGSKSFDIFRGGGLPEL